MLTERKERLPGERYPYFAIVGGVGVGKSELAKLLQQNFGLPLFEEEFVDNPYLKPFYTEDPKKYAFKSQIFFLANEVRQMHQLRERLTKEPVGHDQYLKGDAFFESILWGEMGFISDAEHRDYCASYQKMTEGRFVPEADIYVGITASEETVVRRILERGREMELTMHERYPDYFPAIARSFDSWLRVLSRHHPVLIIDTDKWDFVSSEASREDVLNEFRNLAGYYLSSPSQLNLTARDGARLIFPSFLIPRTSYADIAPGLSAEQKMLQRR